MRKKKERSFLTRYGFFHDTWENIKEIFIFALQSREIVDIINWSRQMLVFFFLLLPLSIWKRKGKREKKKKKKRLL